MRRGLLLLCVVAGPAIAGSLPQVVSGPRPGPDLLYAAPPRAPQLENVTPWMAEPILVSGASAYRDGEFLYQDYLFDDHGAAGSRDPGDPYTFGDFTTTFKAGTLTYPDDPAYANNAADLVELRVKPLEHATAFRVTLNSMIDPARTAFTIALGESDGLRAWPHGAGVSSPAQWFLTVHGDAAEFIDAGSGAVVAPAPAVSVDLERRQITVQIPHAAWNPGRDTVRMAAGAGLWDAAANTYLAPAASRTVTVPGGAASNGAALFNLAFRYDEPLPYIPALPVVTPADIATRALENAWWRELAQSEALAGGDISRFHADVDFAKLADEVDDDSLVPKAGPLNRIYASRFEPHQGADYSKACGRFPGVCDGIYGSQLQPYAIYVPQRAMPPQGWGYTFLLHALGQNYNAYTNGNFARPLGERGAGSVVVTPGARGPDGDYTDLPEADLFEVWADVARHYPLDAGWTASAGYSMGGGGTLKLLSRWPDLFARGMSGGAVSLPVQGAKLEPLRNVPLMTWIGGLDEGTPPTSSLPVRDQMIALGLEFVFDLFPAFDHLALPANENWSGIAEFLGEQRVRRDVPHVSYAVDPAFDRERTGIVANHAYWLSDMRVRDGAAGLASVDAQSLGYGLGDPVPSGASTSYGVLTGGAWAAAPYQRTTQTLGPAPEIPVEDRLIIKARNLAAMTIDVQRARLSCAPHIELDSDGPVDIVLAGCDEDAAPVIVASPADTATPQHARYGGAAGFLTPMLLAALIRRRKPLP